MINNLVHRPIARSVYQLVIDNYQKYFPASLKLDFTSNLLDSKINFSRTSNATVTRSDGTIGYAPHNLLSYSEQFDNAYWTKTNTTITANSVTAPNGTLTADTLTATAVNSQHNFYKASVLMSGQLHALSIYVKAGTYDRFGIGSNNGIGIIKVNLTTGEIISGAGTVEDAGDGWWRVTTSFVPGGANGVFYGLLDTSGKETWDATGTESIYIWGAQAEIGSTATTYNSTTVKNLLGYTEAFDNAAWTKSNSFVQTNLLTYSEAFDNAAWTKALSSVSANAITSPNGYQTGDKLIASASSGVHSLAQGSFNLPIASFSIYAKKGEYNFCTFIFIGGGIRATRTFNLTTGEITNPYDVSATTISATATDVGDGWYRLALSCTSSSFTTVNIALAEDTVNNHTFSGQTFTGDGTSGIYLWGAQLVQGSDAGDYRRTDAAALPVYYPNHNGVVCAEKLVENTATAYHAVYGTTITAGTYMASIYAKAGERNFLQLAGGNSVNDYITFNLSTGVITQTGSGATLGSITDVGGGWYRCSARMPLSVTGVFVVACQAGTSGWLPSAAGDGTSGIYIFGAQLSDSASLDPYVLNAGVAPTAAAYYGARFDYDPVTLEAKGLLIEEQRANLLLNSSLAGTNLATQNVTVTAVAHTLSFYGDGEIVLSGTASATVTGTGAYPTRSTLTFTPTAGTLTVTVSGTVQFAQLEAGAFATSYIPTAASQVTRTADVATIQGSNFYSWYNQNEGSFSGQSSVNLVTGANASVLVGVSNGTINFVMLFGQYLSSAIRTNITLYNGAIQVNLDEAVSYPVNIGKIAGTYSVNNFAGTYNSSVVDTDNTGQVPQVSLCQLGSNYQAGTPTQYLNGHIKQISYYPTRLSNDVLKGLTA